MPLTTHSGSPNGKMFVSDLSSQNIAGTSESFRDRVVLQRDTIEHEMLRIGVQAQF